MKKVISAFKKKKNIIYKTAVWDLEPKLCM